MEGFYAGLTHPLTDIAQLTALAALGLLLSLRFPNLFATAWGCFASAAAIGAAAALLSGLTHTVDGPLLAAAAATAMLTALAPQCPAAAVVIVSVVNGGLIGVASAPESGSTGATLVTLFGSFVGVSLTLIYLASGVGWLREKLAESWTTLGVRVIAAWIAAIALLVAALAATGRLEGADERVNKSITRELDK